MSTGTLLDLDLLASQLDDQTCQAGTWAKGFLGTDQCGKPATWVWLFTGCPHEWMVFLCDEHHKGYSHGESAWVCKPCGDMTEVKILRKELK